MHARDDPLEVLVYLRKDWQADTRHDAHVDDYIG